MDVRLYDDHLSGMRVVVMGLGRFGGGAGVVRFLAARGARVLVTDLADAASLRESIDAIAHLDVELRLGEHRESDLDAADLLVISPAVDRRRSEFVAAARTRGIPWTTEMNLFLARCPGRVLGVTGSVGKSTTSAMLHAILDSSASDGAASFRRAFLGGNIGCSLLEQLHEIGADDVVVLELSSFQLEAVTDVCFRPCVAGLTNATPHHLDRHGDFESYLGAKLNLFRSQGPGDTAVAGECNPCVRDRLRATAVARGACFVDAVLDQRRYDLRVPGRHNLVNAHMSVTMARCLGVVDDCACRAVSEFAGLPHRLQYVRTLGGVKYYNDSKSTSAESVATALQSFETPVVLLCGGKDTGDELLRIAEGPWQAVRVAICFGDAGGRLHTLLSERIGTPGACQVHYAPAMVEAMELARATARDGDVVLLSPGCPSYDQFTNYVHRGDVFVRIVQAWSP